MTTAIRRPTRWRVLPGRANVVLWCAVGAVGIALTSVSAPLSVSVYAVPLVLALLFSLALGASIPLSLVFPVLGAVVALIGGVMLSALAPYTPLAPWSASVTTIVGVSLVWFFVGWRAPWFVVSVAWFLGVVLMLMATAHATHPEEASASVIANLVVFEALTLGAAVVGIVTRNWDSVRTQLVAERAQSAAEVAHREAVEEKTRIARELHDVVAHGMSAIQVRAASAKYRLQGLTPEAIAEFDDIAATARTSMGDMRSILGVLRDEHQGPATSPQPGISDLRTLIDRARALAPVTVRGSWTLTPAERADKLLGITIYRAIQEALSNSARHAPGASVIITWSESQTSRRVDVENASSAIPSDAARSGGQGLRGMRERLHVLGGTAQTANTASGGFVIRLTIPRSTPQENPR